MLVSSISWFPRFRKTDFGSFSFRAKMDRITSMDQEPRSTKSPLKTNGVLGEGFPVMLSKFKKSQY